MSGRIAMILLAAVSYLVTAVAPCPDPSFAELNRGADRAVEHADMSRGHHHHHHGEQPAIEVDAAKLEMACPCGCGGKARTDAAGGKLGPRLVPELDDVPTLDSTTPVSPLVVARHVRAGSPPDPIPI